MDPFSRCENGSMLRLQNKFSRQKQKNYFWASLKKKY